jgi:hypothetical protein
MLDELEELASRLDSTAVWRSQKAAEYPNDRQNAEAARTLNDLARQVRGIHDKSRFLEPI